MALKVRNYGNLINRDGAMGADRSLYIVSHYRRLGLLQAGGRSKFLEAFRADMSRHCKLVFHQEERLTKLDKLRLIAFSKGLIAITVYRMRVWADFELSGISKILFSAISAVLNVWVRAAYGIHIDKRARIGKGFYIGHFGGIRIGPCRIGNNCSVHQQVRIGACPGKTGGPNPTIGDCVWIGAHAQILGDVSVASFSTIAPGAQVKRDVLAGTLVMGAPARVVNTWYDNRFLL
jgi:serine O-acetyltransferase